MPADLETALYLASLGFYIAPLQVNSKLPSGHWKHQSSRDPITITGWFSEEFMGVNVPLNIMVDTGRSGLCVVDVDTKPGKVGAASLAALIAKHGPLPETLTVTTASGGLHYYFRAEGFANTASKIGEDIDTRAEGGYVVAPSSTIDDKNYYISTMAEVAGLPNGWRKHSAAIA